MKYLSMYKLIMKQEISDTITCIYVVMYRPMFGHQTDHFAWWQAVHYPLVFKFVMNWEPRVLFQYVAVSISFLVTKFKEYAGNGFPRLVYVLSNERTVHCTAKYC